MSYGLDDDHGGPDPSHGGDGGGGGGTALSYDYDGDTSSTNSDHHHRALGALPPRAAAVTVAPVLHTVLPAEATRTFTLRPQWSPAAVIARVTAFAGGPSHADREHMRHGAASPLATMPPQQHVKHAQPHAGGAAVAPRFWRGKAAHLLIAGEYDDDITSTLVAAGRPVVDAAAVAMDTVASVVHHESAALRNKSTAAVLQPLSLAQQQPQQPKRWSQQAEAAQQPTQSQGAQHSPLREVRYGEKQALAYVLPRGDPSAAVAHEGGFAQALPGQAGQALPGSPSSDPAGKNANASFSQAFGPRTHAHAQDTTVGNSELLRRRRRR